MGNMFKKINKRNNLVKTNEAIERWAKEAQDDGENVLLTENSKGNKVMILSSFDLEG